MTSATSRATIRVFSNAYWSVERATSQLLLIVRRSPESPTTIGELEGSFKELEKVLDSYNRKHFVLLVDLRAAPHRNDPQFEKAVARQPRAFARDFLRSAVLVRTASGRLQVERHLREQGVDMDVFHQETEALEHLATCQRRSDS